MNLYGLNKLTLLDYPEHLACLIFTGLCNYRCPFCHNASLVLDPDSQPRISEDAVFDFLRSRVGILEGVCISGGEPTLQPELPDFIRRIKALGFRVKLDTNGSRPGILKDLLEQGLLDYVVMDIKSSPKKYLQTIGLPGPESMPEAPNFVTESVQQSAALLMGSDLPYEFRTTLVRELHTKDDLLAIGAWLKGGRAYYLQAFRDSETLVGAAFGSYHAYLPEEMRAFQAMLTPYFGTVGLRGIG